MTDTTTPPVRREDILVSVCFGDLGTNPAAFDNLLAFAGLLAARFRFWEIVLVAMAEDIDTHLQLVNDIPNLRLVKVRHGTEFYRRRAIAASEAIGDVVVLTGVAELALLDVLGMVDRAHAEDKVIVGRLGSASALDRLIASPLVALGEAAGFDVSIYDMQTIVFPRTLLSQILSHPAKELALRFLPRDTGLPRSYITAAKAPREVRSLHDLGRRLRLADQLLINVAPGLLRRVTLLSVLIAMLSFFYLIYTISVWFILPRLQPGWLTISVMLSLTGFMLGLTISGLSLGMQFLISRIDPTGFDDVADEVNRIDLFGQVARDLNVEVYMEPSDRSPNRERL
ncbi:MAG: hypothetical protein ABI832_06275 [bacterium]